MNLQKILKSFKNCPCGRKHEIFTEAVEIESGITQHTGALLSEHNFGKKILLVADNNTLTASQGILESLEGSGYDIKKLVYGDMKYAKIEQVEEVKNAAYDRDSIISVGTGSLNDICRVASFETKKKFCIFATAPSMDGFASDTAPIIKNNFKSSYNTEQPSLIIADTKILAKAPTVLKSSGFGDMAAKYIGIADWKISHILTGEYYCENVARLSLDAANRCFDLAQLVTSESEEAAGAIAEALILSGIAMKLAGCSRPASGAEHVVSHYLECEKIAKGIWPEYHGRKVGVATVIINRIYRKIAHEFESISPQDEVFDLQKILPHYNEKMHRDIIKLNSPTVTEGICAEALKNNWQQIRSVILSTLPDDDYLLKKMKTAGAATTPEEVNVSPELLNEALRYHPYMRHRILLTRLMPMLGIDIVKLYNT